MCELQCFLLHTADFISASVRLILYPFTSYVIFRYTYKLNLNSDVVVDPWCLDSDYNVSIQQAFQWEHQEIGIFTVHVMCGFLAYIISWLACFMNMHRFGLALPVLLATPFSVPIVMKLNLDFGFQMDSILLSPNINVWLIVAFITGALLQWVGQILITTHSLFRSRNVVLALEKDMFVRPYYSSILVEQYLILNRNTCIRAGENDSGGSTQNPKNYTVFICSTMYREKIEEMEQMLRSIRRVAVCYKVERKKSSDKRRFNKFESHIFFDGGCNGQKILPFALQLLSLIEKTLGVSLKQTKRVTTSYGCRFQWTIEDEDSTESVECDEHNGMVFCIHLKDNSKIKNKKRWSQVMYMNYVINYRAKNEELDLENTFILTTDADIDFEAKSAVVLLDMLTRDAHVGAVSARTYPIGHGLIYWYQIFDYAVGHWLQKPAQHILGCVLCCPGCFSIFRCSALNECLNTYSENVNNAYEFLTKDMGEDRWLCTLLIEKGWRLDYCSISSNKTYCPVDFDEFFKQRRRWIPSTIANLWLLISSGKQLTHENTSINYLFIIYQAFLFLSILITPSTVILIVTSGLVQAYGVNQVAVLILVTFISTGYGLLCLFTKQKTQLDIAKLLTTLFAILMVIVVVGLIKETIRDLKESPTTLNRTENFILPIATSTFYIGLFTLIFLVTALLHYRELFSLIHCIWYLLGLPGGYLFLLIYSIANLNSRSWGTREESDNTKSMFAVLYNCLKESFYACIEKVKLSSQKEGDRQTTCARKEDTIAMMVEDGESEDEEQSHELGICCCYCINNYSFWLLSTQVHIMCHNLMIKIGCMNGSKRKSVL